MSVFLIAPLWFANARLQRAANNNPAMRENERDTVAVKLLQEAMILSGFRLEKGADGKFGPKTASMVVTIQRFFGFKPDAGIVGREVMGVLDLTMRGYDPPPGPHWGGLLAKTIVPIAQGKVNDALQALTVLQKLLTTRKFSATTADAVTLDALRVHFKLVPSGGAKLSREEFISLATINPLIANFAAIKRTLANPNMIRHTVCTGGPAGPQDQLDGLTTAAESPFGGPISFGPPYSDFSSVESDITNIVQTGPNSLAAMMMHEATHVIDRFSGFTPSQARTTHISESEPEYETQNAEFARHNPSAFATFAAHIFQGSDRPREERFGLSPKGRPF